MRVPFTLLAVLVLVLAAACGGDDDDDDVGSIEDAESCDDVGAVFLDEMQTMLDALSELEMTDLEGDEPPEALTEFQQNVTEIGEKSEELDCTDEQMANYLQENIDDLEANGTVAELVLEGLREGIQSGEIFNTPGN